MSDGPADGETDPAAETESRGAEVPDARDGSGEGGESATGRAEVTASDDEAQVDVGETLFYEAGGSWLAVLIGPILVIVLLILEIVGGGRIHWEVLLAFGLMLAGFGYVQKAAAERHVSVLLTETMLREGAQRVALADIAKIFPENHGGDYQKWESARALGELPAVPRRRKGIGVELADGTLRQAWARDVERFRTELTEAHLAVKMGLEPKKRS